MPTTRNIDPQVARHRGRKAVAIRDGRHDTALAADRDMRAAMLEKSIRELALEKLPPLTDSQRVHLASLLSGTNRAA